MSGRIPSRSVTANHAPLRRFIAEMSHLIGMAADTQLILDAGSTLLAELIASDGWLDEEFAMPDTERYRQSLLYCDGLERFSVVSFVWGPGQATPIHDHRVWGLVGVLRGCERVERFFREASGDLSVIGEPTLLKTGQVDKIDPQDSDIHRVANGVDDGVSVSIHVYGANIGTVSRATYDSEGREKLFVSGYANNHLPNIWHQNGSL